MSFGAPAFLLALLLVPASVAWYLYAERCRRRATAQFASPATMPSVAPNRPGWRRHLPRVAYLAALAVLAIALARPEATVAVDTERASVVLAIDQSGSMEATDVSPSRLEAARGAALGFLDDAGEGVRVGAVAFNDRVRGVAAPSTDREQPRLLLEGLTPGGGTAIGEALAASLRTLRTGDAASGGPPSSQAPPAAVVLISDGKSRTGRDPLEPAREAADLGVPVHTVALGTEGGTVEVPAPGGGTTLRPTAPDRATLDRIAQITGGEAFDALDAEELDSVYERLGSQLAPERKKQEITAAFAAGGLLLLLSGGAMSLRWFGRLP